MSDQAAVTTEATTTEATTEASTEGTLLTENTTEATTTEATTEASTEAETTTDAEAEAADNAEGDDAPQGAPEEYAEFTMPEGIPLDEAAADELKAAAKEMDLSQEKAQKLVDIAAAMRQRDVDTIIATRDGWLTETRADPEIGGDKLDASLAVAKRGLDAYGSPKLVELLNQSGLGNHPEIIRAFAKAGTTVSEDKAVAGGSATSGERTLAQRLYSTPEAKK